MDRNNFVAREVVPFVEEVEAEVEVEAKEGVEVEVEVDSHFQHQDHYN